MARGSSNGKRPRAARSHKYAPKEMDIKARDNLQELQEIRNTEVPKYTDVKNTNSAYRGHRARGFGFLKNLVAKRKKDESTTGPNDDGICTATLEKAFDESGPNQYSALALEMFLVQKCYNEGCGRDTADGIHGAFAQLWDRIEGGMYSGEYSFNKNTGEVRGCPARAANVKAVVHSVKVRDKQKGASATRNHADAMTVEDLRKIMTWSEQECPPAATAPGGSLQGDNIEGLVHRLEHGFMQAFLSAGFTLWTRCFELLDLQPRDIDFNGVGPSPHHLSCFKVELLNRKGWQNEKGYEGAREPHIYNIYAQPQHPEMDMYEHLGQWKALLESVLQRPLEPDEYMFPHIGVNGVIRPDRKMTYDGLMKLLSHFCKQSGIDKRYTTHSLRRGGAQYRFMYGPVSQRWDLNRIRWWGGWAIGEECDTLIKYLVDSLQNLLNDHGDALNPYGNGHPDGRFLGESNSEALSPLSTEEWRAATAATDDKIVACFEAVQHLANSQPVPRQLHHILPAQHNNSPLTGGSSDSVSESDYSRSMGTNTPSRGSSMSPDAPVNIPRPSGRSSRAKNHCGAPRMVPLPNVSIPLLGRKPGAWRQALKQWTQIDPKTGIALMDWPVEWYTGTMSRVTGSLRGQRQLVFEEYHRLGGNDTNFLEVYPDADSSLKRLIDAIRANPDSNTERPRVSKNGTPETRGSREPQSRSPSEMLDDDMDVVLDNGMDVDAKY